MQEIGCAIRIAMRRILWQEDLGDRVGSSGVKIRCAIEHARIEDEGVYLIVSIIGGLSRSGLADIGNQGSGGRFDSVGM